MAHTAQINASVAMLASLFGNPNHADADINHYEWLIRFDDASQVILRNVSQAVSAGRMQTWEVSSDSETAIAQLKDKLEQGENYYEGSLHPELFIHREED